MTVIIPPGHLKFAVETLAYLLIKGVFVEEIS